MNCHSEDYKESYNWTQTKEALVLKISMRCEIIHVKSVHALRI